MARLFWSAAALSLLLALLSYSPLDPSWSTWTSRTDYHNWMGRLGGTISDLLLQLFGFSAFGVALLIGSKPFRQAPKETTRLDSLSPIAFVLSLSSLLQALLPLGWTPWHLQNPGGIAGSLLNSGLAYFTGAIGAKLLSLCLFLASVILLFRWHLVTWTLEAFKNFVPRFKERCHALANAFVARMRALRAPREVTTEKKATAKEAAAAKPIEIAVRAHPQMPEPQAKAAAEVEEEDDEDEEEGEEGQSGPPMKAARSEADEELFRMVARGLNKPTKKPELKPKPKAAPGEYQLPGLNLLSGRAEAKAKPMDKNWYLEKGNILVQKLKDFGVEGEIVHISPGPVITVYEFKPASGVKIKEIANLSDDLTLALSVLSVRIVAPIPGKPVVGIEIPSPHRETVFFKDMIEETPFYTSDIRIPVVLGRLASGEPVVAGLATMPHLLVAGSTGTGKSVFINTLISSLLYRYTPQQLKLILVDPKMVELSSYEGVPHLLLPVVVDSKKAAAALRWTVDEMERRYSLMHQMGVRHLDAYNEKIAEQLMNTPIKAKEPVEDGMPEEEPPKVLPYIVVVIDEYADLMAVVPKDVELSIARLAQKARASGIHLVLATQRPSTDVVTGTIKANFPSRISFRVASSVDSKTILDRTGAERLLGNGDMLFHSAGFTTLKRLQGAFLSDADLERVVEHLKAQAEPEYDERILQTQMGDGEDSDGGDADEGSLYDRAVRLVADKGEASISLIQRHLKIGYNRAAALMEQMEKDGVVAPSSPGAGKRRAVLVNNL